MKHSYTLKTWLFILSMCLSMMSFLSADAQITGIKNIPGDYPTLAAAVTDLNTQGVGAGGVTLNLLAGNPQTAPAGGYSITAGGSLANPVLLEGNGNTITASGSLVAGDLTDAIIEIVGGDFITIQNFTLQENAANTVTTAGSNTMTEWGVALLYATTTNGAQNNTVRNCTIDLNRTYQNTFGIYSNSTHSATSATTGATATTTAGANSGLVIHGNIITDVNTGIVVVGPTAAADNNDGLDIGGSSVATGNTITDFGTTGTFSGYVNVSGTVNGILVRNTKNFNVSYNSISSSNGGVTSGTLRGIYVPSFSNAPTGTLANTINNNNISLRSGVASGAMNAIHVEATTVNATTTLNINNNNFHTTTHTVAASGAITFILNAAAALITNINGNTFTNISVNTTGNTTLINNSVTRPANSVTNANNNEIVTAFAKTGPGGTVTLYESFSTTPVTGTEITTGNNFSNITLTGTTVLAGLRSGDGPTSAPFGPVKTVTGNIFNNITVGTGAISYLLYVGYSNTAGTNNVSGNVMTNVTGAGAITVYTSPTGSQNVFMNEIGNISSTGAATVAGIVITGGTVQNVYRNKIYNLQSNNAAGSCIGMSFSATAANTTNNVYNNLIGDLRAPSSGSTSDVIRGISITSTSATSVFNLYYNTIYLNATSTGTDFSTTGIFHTSSATGTTATLNLRNNIIVNASTPNGTGITAAFRRSGTALNNYASTSNNNLFYAGTPGANRLIMYNGTNAYQTLAAYQAAVAPADAQSISENPPFLSTSGPAADFLHIDPNIASGVNNGAQNIAGITDDYDGNVRQGNPGYTGGGTNPDIGADEYEFVPQLLDVGVAALLSPLTTGCPGTADTVRIRIRNYSNQAINFALNPVTINTNVTGPNPQTFPVITLNSGTLAGFATLDTVVFIGYNRTAVGTYTFHSYTTLAGDGTATNDTLVPVVYNNPGGGIATLSPSSGCAGATTALTLSGNTSGTIQWQHFDPGTMTWVNETGTGNTTSPYTASPIADTTLYRALVCGMYASAQDTMIIFNLLPPVANDTSRCGPGPVSLIATASGNIRWYDQATGGNLLGAGDTLSTNVTASSVFYVENSSGSTPAAHTTTFAAGNGFNGNMFGITALNTVTITGFDGHTNSTTPATWEIYYMPADYLLVPNSTTSGTGWILLGTAANVPSLGNGVATPIPITFNVTIPAGQTYSFHVVTTSGAGVNYTNGSAAGAVFNANPEFQFREGHGGSLFSCTNVPRIFNGNIYYNTGCTSARTAVNVTVTPPPAIMLTTSSANICDVDTVTLNVASANTSYQYAWTPNASLSDSVGATVQAFPTANTTYIVSATDTADCRTSDTISIAVNMSPIGVLTVSDNMICSGTADTLHIATSSGGTFSHTGISLPIPDSNPAGARDTITVTGAPYFLSAGDIVSVCLDITHTFDGDLTLWLISPQGTQFDLSSNNGGGGDNYTGTCFDMTAATNIVAGTAPYTGSYVPEGAGGFSTFNGENGNGDWQLWVVDGAGADIGTIDGWSITFIPFSPSIQWSSSPAGLSDTAATVIVNPMVNTVYTVMLTDTSNGCARNYQASVNVMPLPLVDLGPDRNICANDTAGFFLDATAPDISYTWQDQSTAPTFLVQEDGLYYVNVLDTNGCMNSDSVVVAEVQPDYVNIGINFTSTTTATLDAGAGYNAYLWSTLQISPSININSNGVYWVRVNDDNGCATSDTINVIFSLGFENPDGSQVTVSYYPNPSNGYLNMSVAGFTGGEDMLMEILDMGGKKVYGQNFDDITSDFTQPLNLSHLAEGTYMVRISTKQGTYTNRIVITSKL